jgi:hypothetical protein
MIGDTFQLIDTDDFTDDVVGVFIKHGKFRKTEKEDKVVVNSTPTYGGWGRVGTYTKISEESTIEDFSPNEGVDQYLSNHMPGESNIEKIASDLLGFSEERKWWLKEYKTAVKQYGHDEVLSAFYEWCSSQSNFLGKKPVSAFLRSVGSLVGMTARKPLVTNPLLDATEKQIAFSTDNKVFFGGDYRIRLAQLLKTYGKNLVVEAFNSFYTTVDDKSQNFAAKNFLERAEILIATIQRQKAEQQKQEALAQLQYQQAQQQAVPEDDEAEEEL